MVKAACPICLEEYPLSRLRLLPKCGHVFCKRCTRELTYDDHPRCALCKTRVGSTPPCKIFMDVADEVDIARLEKEKQSLKDAKREDESLIRDLVGIAFDAVARGSKRKIMLRLCEQVNDLKVLVQTVKDLDKQVSKARSKGEKAPKLLVKMMRACEDYIDELEEDIRYNLRVVKAI